jgi:hypothetical protein
LGVLVAKICGGGVTGKYSIGMQHQFGVLR